jgi:hypothetical protein
MATINADVTVLHYAKYNVTMLNIAVSTDGRSVKTHVNNKIKISGNNVLPKGISHKSHFAVPRWKGSIRPLFARTADCWAPVTLNIAAEPKPA